MAFVNALLLFGILAVSIPILIQLLTRRHTKKIPWGAMLFLQAAMNKRKRKVLLEDILLLACRCLLPALAALALARPFVTPGSRVPWVVVLPAILLAITLFGISFAMWRYPKWRRLSMGLSLLLAALAAAAVLLERKLNLSRFGGGANKDVALVIDGSSSMSMTGADGKSNFENAVEEAGKYIEGASRGTAFSILLGGPVPEILNPVPVSDRRVLRDTLRSLRPSQGTMRAAPALAAAAVTLAAGNNTVKQIIVAGDGQTVGWDLTSEGRWESIKALFGQLRTPPPVVWRTLPLPASIRNLAVSSVALSREVVGADREVKIRVTVSNPGTEAVTPEEVSLSIGPKTMKARDARQLEPGDSQTFEFSHTFERPGAAVLTASVVSRDDLPEDDSQRLVVPVLDTLRVLVVDGDGAAPAVSRASTYLSLALRPEPTGRGLPEGAAADSAAARGGFLLRTETEDVARVATRKDFSEFAAVALCNVPSLSAATLSQLAEYVHGGGGLLVLPGARTKAPAFNAWAVAGEPVLPMELDAWTSRPADAADAPRIDPSSFSHDALRALRTGSDLGEVAPLQRWRLKAGFGGAAHVAASLTDGSALLAIKPFGAGTVALCALPPDPVSSDLPSRRSFVPFVHELVYSLARPLAADLNVPPSDGATLLLAPRNTGGLSSRAGAPGAGGLAARYYSQRGWKGEFVSRLDPKIDFGWGGSPAVGVPADNFSVLWTGSIVPPATGNYLFHVAGDDRVTLRLAGRDVASATHSSGIVGSAPVALVAGRAVPIELRMEEEAGNAACRLYWTPPGGSREIVPASVLVPSSLSLVEVADPHGETFLAELTQDTAGTRLKVSRSLYPGLYWVKPPEGGFPPGLASCTAADGRMPFSVRAGTEESTMMAISQEQADRLRRFVSLSLATKREDVEGILRGSAFGKEIWRVFALAVLFFLVAEIALSRWISIQRREGQETDVDFTNEGEMGKASFKDALKKLRS